LAASYSYRVRAADGAGNLSAYSNVASTATLSVATVDGRVGAYPFEEGSGTSTADLSGLGNTGTLQGGVTWTTAGQFGKALTFTDGTWVDLGNPGPLQLTGSMTVSAWVKASSFPADDAAIVSKLSNDPPHGFQLDATVDTGVRTIGFKLSNVVGYMIRYGPTELQLNTWYHVAGVYDAGAKTMNVYLNGVLDNGNSFGTVSSSQKDSALSVNIGRRASGAYGFPGEIDEVRIYNRALSQAEIQADMAVSASTPPDGIPPSAPSALTATATSQTQINLSWTASTDNVGVAGYRIERCQGAGCSDFAQIATPTTTTFADTGLTAATSYSYRVRAADGAGNLSGYSNIASATTAGAAGGAQMYFIQTDQLNTPRLIATSTGTTVWRWDQGEPFGNDVPNNNPSGAGAFDFPLRFPGQYFDRETNLAYNYFRDYDPATGRYIQSDPMSVAKHVTRWRVNFGTPAQAPLELDTYAFVSGNPLHLVDPTGLYECWYSISAHTMVCSPDNPGNPLFTSSDFVSGRNGPGCSDCQNNPNRINVTNWGPIPPGTYNIGRSNSNGRRDLTPNPNNGRTDFQLHACPNPATCSWGCVASPRIWSQLNNMLSSEDGNNTLTVAP
jgi:RHS repeat-associated protein